MYWLAESDVMSTWCHQVFQKLLPLHLRIQWKAWEEVKDDCSSTGVEGIPKYCCQVRCHLSVINKQWQLEAYCFVREGVKLLNHDLFQHLHICHHNTGILSEVETRYMYQGKILTQNEALSRILSSMQGLISVEGCTTHATPALVVTWRDAHSCHGSQTKLGSKSRTNDYDRYHSLGSLYIFLVDVHLWTTARSDLIFYCYLSLHLHSFDPCCSHVKLIS